MWYYRLMAKVTPKTKEGKTAQASKKKSAASKSRDRANMIKELKTLVPKLDDDGLAFFVKQFHVHLYNMQVDALNQTMITGEERKKASAAKKPAKKSSAGFSEIKMSDTGSSYYIVYNNEWIAFSKEEMTILVKIIYGEGTDLEIRERLYNWFAKERMDLLNSASIGNKFDDKLKALVRLLKDNFKLRKK